VATLGFKCQMIKVSHLKPSGNYMYNKLQHYESLHFATQNICFHHSMNISTDYFPKQH